MEYLSGGELFERVVDEDFILTESDCQLYMRQILRGVGYLHDNRVVHLDLKPENVVCVARNSNIIKIIDFGLAKVLQPGEDYRAMCGTAEFVAPEIVSYDRIGPSTDIWSLGVIAYILLSGLSPFLGDTDLETYSNISGVRYSFEDPMFDIVSPAARDFIQCLLQKNPERRPSAEQCLSHPWMLQEDETTEKTVLSTANLAKFLARRRWKKNILGIIAMRRLWINRTRYQTIVTSFSIRQKQLRTKHPKAFKFFVGDHINI